MKYEINVKFPLGPEIQSNWAASDALEKLLPSVSSGGGSGFRDIQFHVPNKELAIEGVIKVRIALNKLGLKPQQYDDDGYTVEMTKITSK